MDAGVTANAVTMRLELQATRLEALARSLEERRHALPRARWGAWRGPAHDAYALGLLVFDRQVAALSDRVRLAARDTRRAIQTVGGRG